MRYDLAGVPIKSQLRKPDQGTERRFRIKQLCDEGLLDHASGINFGDVDNRPSQPVVKRHENCTQKCPPPKLQQFSDNF